MCLDVMLLYTSTPLDIYLILVTNYLDYHKMQINY